MAEGRDQAAGLRGGKHRAGVQVIAVTSGKGGVGKTNVSVNLAIALSARGLKVMLLDADLSLGNADLLLGLSPRRNLADVVDGLCSLDEVILPGPGDIRLVPAASGAPRMPELGPAEHAGLVRAFGDLSAIPDVLVVDTAAGASPQVTSFARAAQEIVLVLCDEPASLTDAYALMKILNRDHGRDRFRLLANMTRSAAQARELYLRILRVSDRFLSVSLDYMGMVPDDDSVRRAVQRQRAVVEAFPDSPAALAFKKLAASTDNWPVPDGASGQLEFFVERLIQASQGQTEVPV